MTNSTVSEKGVKSVLILTTGHETDRFTVMLACLGDGTKLPPYVVMKATAKERELLERCYCPMPGKWVDGPSTCTGLAEDRGKVGGLTRKKSMLVWDSFRAHLSAPILSTLKSLNTEPAVIPGGMTSMVQPLDVAINKPFKDRTRKKWQEWMLADQHFHCNWTYPQSGITSDLPVELRGLGRHSKRAR